MIFYTVPSISNRVLEFLQLLNEIFASILHDTLMIRGIKTGDGCVGPEKEGSLTLAAFSTCPD